MCTRRGEWGYNIASFKAPVYCPFMLPVHSVLPIGNFKKFPFLHCNLENGAIFMQ